MKGITPGMKSVFCSQDCPVRRMSESFITKAGLIEKSPRPPRAIFRAGRSITRRGLSSNCLILVRSSVAIEPQMGMKAQTVSIFTLPSPLTKSWPGSLAKPIPWRAMKAVSASPSAPPMIDGNS
jgi:hypothetical protein